MPSLKDLRNRITSVKATRKITKAMQMVAAAKLRRAQEVATAARPYADRMDQMMASLGARVTDKGASPLLVGTGRDQVHLLIVMTGERGLAGGFNTNISKLARQDAQRLLAKGKTVKMHHGGPQGRRSHAARVRLATTSTASICAASARSPSPTPTRSPRSCSPFTRPASSTSRRSTSRSSSRVIAQKPTALQLIPAKLPGRQAAEHRQRRGHPRIRAERGGGPRRSRHAQHLDADLPRAAGERRLLLRRADERHGLQRRATPAR